MSNVIREELFKSLAKRYESEIQSNCSTMLIYFNNSVGIGEHPQHLEEMDVLIGNITDANDKLETLFREFEEYK
tara:strand:- start:275 stop:496 length:222 start_codon:yes stop_codon:yes gene_type:complete